MTVSAPEDELAAAAVSQWTTRVVAFTRWVGAGRKLTQTGRLTLAHARELVELLDTGDVLDPPIGGQVHRTKSSEELPELNTVFEWAKAARLVRVTGGRLMAVKKNAALLERPLPLWERMFETFGALGPAICPPGWGESLLRSHFAEGMPAVLSAIYRRDGPVSLTASPTVTPNTVCLTTSWASATSGPPRLGSWSLGWETGSATATTLVMVGSTTLPWSRSVLPNPTPGIPCASPVQATVRLRTAAACSATSSSAKSWPIHPTPSTRACGSGWAWQQRQSSTRRGSTSTPPTRHWPV